MKTFLCSKDKIVKAPFKYSLRELANIWSCEREKVIIYVNFKCIKFGYL